MEKLQQENLELVRKLASQEEALGRGNRQLEQQTSECQALTRQLESALLDVKRQVRRYSIISNYQVNPRLAVTEPLLLIQVNKVKEQAVSKEEALQTKILELEAEKSHRDHEIRLLLQGKHMVTSSWNAQVGWRSPVLAKAR